MGFKQKLIISVLAVLIIAVGFLRDFVFVSINQVIESGNDTDKKFLMIKWALTAVFSAYYLANTCALLYFIFQSRKYMMLAVYSYGVLVSASILAATAGSLFSSFHSIYPFVRTIMGIAQSPIIAMILIPFCMAGMLKK